MVELRTSTDSFNISGHLIQQPIFSGSLRLEKVKGVYPFSVQKLTSCVPLAAHAPPRVPSRAATLRLRCPLHAPLRRALVTARVASPCTPPPHVPPFPPLVTARAALPCTSQSHAPLRCACRSRPRRPRHPPRRDHDHDCGNNTPNTRPPPQCDHDGTTAATAT
jgi:hypothetical protein